MAGPGRLPAVVVAAMYEMWVSLSALFSRALGMRASIGHKQSQARIESVAVGTTVRRDTAKPEMGKCERVNMGRASTDQSAILVSVTLIEAEGFGAAGDDITANQLVESGKQTWIR